MKESEDDLLVQYLGEPEVNLCGFIVPPKFLVEGYVVYYS